MTGNTSLQLSSVEVPFTGRTAEPLVEFITHSKFVQNLHIWSCHKVQEEGGIESITKALACNTSLPLKSLTLPAPEISDTAADSLALFIQECATLEFVSWEGSGTTLITACGLREMANAEHHYSWLPPAATEGHHHCVVNCIEDGIDFDRIWQHHSFHGAFTCHNIGDEGACSFGASLIKNSTVGRLSFNSNHAHPVLTKVLHHSRCHLSNKKISDVGATAVAQALHHNSILWELDLSNNSVSDAGATAIAQALHHNSTLEKLDLSNNSISDVGVTAIAQALHHNSRLHSLYVSGNDDILEEGTCRLVQALTQTTCSEGWWTHYGGLVLPKRCEEFATQCPEYVQVKTSVKFV